MVVIVFLVQALAESFLEDLKGKGLEVIYVPGDRDEASFNEYFGEMPWLAVDFNDKATVKPGLVEGLHLENRT